MRKDNLIKNKWYHLYKRNAKGIPLFWSGAVIGDTLTVKYGTTVGVIRKETIATNRLKLDELSSRINAKQKEGYKFITEIRDTTEESIIKLDGDYRNPFLVNYLKEYLPKYNTTSEGFVLPMLAKTLEDNKPFDKYGVMLGQWKINGLRCIIGATEVRTLFDKVKLTYHSREGVDWTDKLGFLDDILIPQIDIELLYMMSHEGVCLDGELYLPGYSVNDINSFVKNTGLEQHKKIQYWLYDICIENMSAENRKELIAHSIFVKPSYFSNKDDHLNNTNQLVVLPTVDIPNISFALTFRDDFISYGFEGLILRNPAEEYQFGKRNSAMFKFKRIDDGIFEIMEIHEDKRGLPIFVLKNDINDSLFECTINLSQDQQRLIVQNKLNYIGKKGTVEFRERSGIQQVPFHAKLIKIL